MKSSPWLVEIGDIFWREWCERVGDLGTSSLLLLFPVLLAGIWVLALGQLSDLRQAGVAFWLIVYIAAASLLEFLTGKEQAQGTRLILLYKDPFGVFWGKVLFSFLYLALLESLVLPLALAVAAGGELTLSLSLVALALGVNAFLATSSVLLGLLSAQAGNKSVLFLLLSLPLVMPVLLTAGYATAGLATAQPLAPYLIALSSYTGVVICTAQILVKEMWWL